MTTLNLTLTRGAMQVTIERHGKVSWHGEAGFETPAELEALLAALRAQAGFDPAVRHARVTLAPPLVQRRLLRNLPPVAPRALRELVALQQSRFFRRNGKPLATAARWLEGNGLGTACAEAIAIEEPWLDAVDGGLQQAGFRLEHVTVEESPLTLLPRAEEHRRDVRRQRTVRWLGATAVACWLAAAVAHAGRLVLDNQRLGRELAELEKPAEALLQLRRQVSATANVLETMHAAEARRNALSVMLAQVVAALPDSAYLASVSLDSLGQAVLTGAARQPSAYVAQLEQGTGLPRPRLENDPASDGGSGGWERFTIRLLRERGL